MLLESLGNELLLNLFAYCNVVDLFRAFYGLNSRFNDLLVTHFHEYIVDFQSVSKRDFDLFCRDRLPLIRTRVVSLRLCNDHETPNLPDHFFRNYFNINQFPHLACLQLHGFGSIDLLLTILSNDCDLSSLTHLKITECSFSDDKTLQDLMENIWDLPKLTYCHLDTAHFTPTYSLEPTWAVSKTIKYLFIKTIDLALGDLFEPFSQTPNLQHVCATLENESVLPHWFIGAPSITKLNLCTNYSQSTLDKLFEFLPNLSHVTLEITNEADPIYLDGHQWKQMIIDRLYHIKVFRFFLKHRFAEKTNVEKKVDEILDTFRTPFWLDERRWFLRCDWSLQITGETISLYTLPHCCTDMYDLYSPIRSKSTCSVEEDRWPLNDVCHAVPKNLLFQNDFSSFLFPKIGHLKITLPKSSDIWTFIRTLNYLTSLEVSLGDKTALSQLQTLIDQAPRCCSLTVANASPLQLAQLVPTHTQLRQVSLSKYSFNAPECSLFASSPLGRQCEVLTITVTDRRYVPDLIKEMPNLRAMTCICVDDKWAVDESLALDESTAAEWLQDRLSPTCLISQQLADSAAVQVWIR